MAKDSDKLPPIAVNRKARFDYFIEERYEAGIALLGWEVKSMRAGQGPAGRSLRVPARTARRFSSARTSMR